MRKTASSVWLLALGAASLPAKSVRAEDGLKGIETFHGACKKLTVAEGPDRRLQGRLAQHALP
ncbi:MULTISPECIES: hypothetical protein [unclassified Bradyrhizobium]|uniref:hypothetical protein n=1 Tax=unclassified Bradyrhizobium TaxID=2631580 RepID=UPI0028F0C0D0|nr:MULTISPECIES: hypothetical protein [unclassified Bradyrhizobium]